MKLFVYKLDQILYEGEAEMVVLPSETGELSILPNHAPITTSLKKGNVKIKNKNDVKELNIENGFAQINQKQIILLVK